MTKSTVVRILTDTTAVLPSEYIEAHGLEVIPQIIIFGQESYLEDYEISYSEFIRRLKASVDLPKTAAPPIGEAVKALERLMVEAGTVICIHPLHRVERDSSDRGNRQRRSLPRCRYPHH
jgi:fatty acid-binding protein DegV